MSQPLVSVIIPLFNAENFIKECLNSVLKQTYKNLEIIIVDDGSTDKSKEIVFSFLETDPRIQYHYQNNSGPSIARNKGINLAKGEYIYFIDSDDYILPVTIESCVQEIQERQSDIVFFNGYLFFPTGEKSLFWEDWITENVPSYTADISSSDRIAFFTNACTCFYRASFLNDNHIRFTDGIYYEDLDFQYNVISKIKSYSFINKKFYFYRRSIKTSITSCLNSKSLDLFTAYRHAKTKLTASNRWDKLEYTVLLNTIRHSYGKFSRDIMLYSSHQTKIAFFNSLKEFLSEIENTYLESITYHLGRSIQADIFRIKTVSFNKYQASFKIKQQVKFKILSSLEKIGVKENVRIIVLNLKNILRSIKDIMKAFIFISRNLIKQRTQ